MLLSKMKVMARLVNTTIIVIAMSVGVEVPMAMILVAMTTMLVLVSMHHCCHSPIVHKVEYSHCRSLLVHDKWK